MATSNTAAAPATDALLLTIYSILSDKDCARILQMIFEGRHLKISDFGTKKRYYDRMAKLKRAYLIIKKGERNKDDETSLKLTALGSIVYESLLSLRRVVNLRWPLRAVDALNEGMPVEIRNQLIEALIPDEIIRNFLLK